MQNSDLCVVRTLRRRSFVGPNVFDGGVGQVRTQVIGMVMQVVADFTDNARELPFSPVSHPYSPPPFGSPVDLPFMLSLVRPRPPQDNSVHY